VPIPLAARTYWRAVRPAVNPSSCDTAGNTPAIENSDAPGSGAYALRRKGIVMLTWPGVAHPVFAPADTEPEEAAKADSPLALSPTRQTRGSNVQDEPRRRRGSTGAMLAEKLHHVLGKGYPALAVWSPARVEPPRRRNTMPS